MTVWSVFLTLVCVPVTGMALFLKNVAFHGILLDALFEEGNREWEEVSFLLKTGIKEGVVRPLRTTVFERNQVEDAFRYMAQGKHIGKVLLKVSTTLAWNACRDICLYFLTLQPLSGFILVSFLFYLFHVLGFKVSTPACFSLGACRGESRCECSWSFRTACDMPDFLSCFTHLRHHRRSRRLWTGAGSLAHWERSSQTGAHIPFWHSQR